MKIRITFDITKEQRRDLNAMLGKPGLADRQTCIAEIEGAVEESLSHLSGPDETEDENETQTE